MDNPKPLSNKRFCWVIDSPDDRVEFDLSLRGLEKRGTLQGTWRGTVFGLPSHLLEGCRTYLEARNFGSRTRGDRVSNTIVVTSEQKPPAAKPGTHPIPSAMPSRMGSGEMGLGGSRSVPDLLVDLKSGNLHGHQRAIRELRSIQPTAEYQKQVAEALASLLSDGNDFTRISGLEALASWHTPEVIPAMIKCTEDPSFAVRWSAIKALGKVKDERAAEAVVKRLAVDRGPATMALKTMGPEAENALIKALEQPNQANPDLLAEICRLLGNIGTTKSLPKLRQLAKSGNFFINAAARQAIRAINTRQ